MEIDRGTLSDAAECGSKNRMPSAVPLMVSPSPQGVPKLIRQWLERWKNWIGDRDMELAIRAELQKQGHSSGQQIADFRLAAIERPGWICIYEFTVKTPNSVDNSVNLFGVARDDGRRKTIVRLYEDSAARDQQRGAWSEGMILAPYLR